MLLPGCSIYWAATSSVGCSSPSIPAAPCSELQQLLGLSSTEAAPLCSRSSNCVRWLFFEVVAWVQLQPSYNWASSLATKAALPPDGTLLARKYGQGVFHRKLQQKLLLRSQVSLSNHNIIKENRRMSVCNRFVFFEHRISSA